jgi:hypothetical protein
MGTHPRRQYASCCALLLLCACDNRTGGTSAPALAGQAGAIAPDPCQWEWQGYGQGALASATCQHVHWLSHAAVLCGEYGGRGPSSVLAEQECSRDGTEVQVRCCFEGAPPPPETPPQGVAGRFSFVLLPEPGVDATLEAMVTEAERRCGTSITDRGTRYADSAREAVLALHYNCASQGPHSRE